MQRYHPGISAICRPKEFTGDIRAFAEAIDAEIEKGIGKKEAKA